jgi:hypothetical protein
MFVEKNAFSDVGWKKTLKKHRNQSNFLLNCVISITPSKPLMSLGSWFIWLYIAKMSKVI